MPADETRESSAVPNEVRYVNLLLFAMCKDDRSQVILRRSHPLPMFPELEHTPDFSHVCNRLKVMCNLELIRSEEPIEGNIQLSISGTQFAIRSYFDEQCADPYCQLTVVVQGATDRAR